MDAVGHLDERPLQYYTFGKPGLPAIHQQADAGWEWRLSEWNAGAQLQPGREPHLQIPPDEAVEPSPDRQRAHLHLQHTLRSQLSLQLLRLHLPRRTELEILLSLSSMNPNGLE